MFQNRMRMFKNQFEQLEDYFKTHDKDNMYDTQSTMLFLLTLFLRIFFNINFC